MKLALISKSLGKEAGGLIPVIQALGGKVSSFGYDVRAFGVKDFSESTDNLEWRNVETSVFDWTGPHAFGYAPRLLPALHKFSPDVLHVHGLFHYTSIAANKYAVECGRNYLVTPHGMLDPWALKNSYWKKRVFGLLFESRHLKGAGCIHSLCSSETNSIRAYGLRSPVCQIPNGIDLPIDSVRFDPPWSTKQQKGKKVLLYLGRIHPKKGLRNLVRAWSDLQKNFRGSEDWLLCIVGWDQGAHEKELKQLAEENGAQNSILFLGPMFAADKVACYQNASGFILPSYSEGFPMVVLEAWSHKLPVLMTSQCNIPEGFSSNAAIEVETDTKALEGDLKTFISTSGTERNRIGQNGYDLVVDKFTWDRVAKEIYSVYEWIVGGGSPPDCVITD